MFYGNSELPQTSLQIEQDDKFFSRLVSKESSFTYPSVRQYYGGVARAVPFTWESSPGTPKHPLSEKLIPPLTPPPYYSNFNLKSTTKQPRSSLLNILFSRLDLNKINLIPPSSSRSSSLRPTAMATAKSHQCSQVSPRGSSSFDSQEDEQEQASSLPTSTLCFGLSRARLIGSCYKP